MNTSQSMRLRSDPLTAEKVRVEFDIVPPQCSALESNSRIFLFIDRLDNLKRKQRAFLDGNGESAIDLGYINGHIQARESETFFVSILLVIPSGRSARNDLNVLHVLADKHNLLNAWLGLITQQLIGSVPGFGAL